MGANSGRERAARFNSIGTLMDSRPGILNWRAALLCAMRRLSRADACVGPAYAQRVEAPLPGERLDLPEPAPHDDRVRPEARARRASRG
jgi:hypothetical protein